jgi:hypothetical protein
LTALKRPLTTAVSRRCRCCTLGGAAVGQHQGWESDDNALRHEAADLPLGKHAGQRLFERSLTVWMGLGILAGVGFGLWVPAVFAAVAALE